MIPYVGSYLSHIKGEAIDIASLIWLVGAWTFGDAATCLVAGFSEKHLGPQMTIIIGGIVYSAGYILTYFTLAMSAAWVILTYGLMAGFGIGLLCTVPIGCATRWFPDNKGFVNGLIAMSMTVGGIIFFPLETALINPTNIPADTDGLFRETEVIERSRNAFLYLGLMSACMLLISGLATCYPDERRITPVCLNNYGSIEGFGKDGIGLFGTRSMHPREILKTRNFYLLWLIIFLLVAAIQSCSGLLKVFAQNFVDDHFYAAVGSISLLFNACSRICWGLLFDKYGFKRVMLGMLTIQTAVVSTLILTPNGGKYMFAAWVIILMICEASYFILFLAYAEVIWGSEYFVFNVGLATTSMFASGALIALGPEAILPVFGFPGFFVAIATITVLVMILTCSIKEPTDEASKDNVCENETGLYNPNIDLRM